MTMLRILLLTVMLFPGLAAAQGWPQRSVRFLVPFPPGGSTDVAARALAEKVAVGLGQQVVVENRGGGGGAVGAGEVEFGRASCRERGTTAAHTRKFTKQ